MKVKDKSNTILHKSRWNFGVDLCERVKTIIYLEEKKNSTFNSSSQRSKVLTTLARWGIVARGLESFPLGRWLII